ncbi:MAG: leucine-rich repeat domain-containing protein [Bacteroidaceae bacterium]|nr:leucine-rich repeat domain-containing protein [Bacteroidaceae bacterium]
MKKFFISFVSLLFLSIASWGDDVATVDGIKYKLNGSNATVTYPNDSKPNDGNNRSSYTGDITIPATITVDEVTYNVTAIGEYAFRSANITSLTLPEGLVTIDYKAIHKTGISQLTIPNSVTTLGQESLSENSNLTTITLGSHIADNKLASWAFWRSSGAYDVYMICDTKAELSHNETFDDTHASTIHVYPSVYAQYKKDTNWNIYNIVADLPKDYTYAELQDIIASNENILNNEVGTDPGYYVASSTTALNNAVNNAKSLTPEASSSDIFTAIRNMCEAVISLECNPLPEGYYYIENVYDGKFMCSYPKPEPENSGILNKDFNQDLKFYFKLIKDGDDWLIQGNDPDHMYFGDPNSAYTNYPTVRVENTYKQKITAVGAGKFKIQYNDGSNLSKPYSNNGSWVTFNTFNEGSADEARMYWRFRNAEILSKTDVANKVATAVGNGETHLDLSGYLLENDVDASDMLASGTNLLVKVASTSGITGQNIVNDGVCANLALTDKEPFGYDEDITATYATYSRNVTNKFGTICLPFAVSSDENVQYYTLNKVENSTLYLTTAATVEAGVPAVFEMKNGTMLTAIASDATVKGSVVNGDGTLKLIGTFAGETITTNLSNSYYISSDKFRQATNSITVNPFRAYFTTTSNEVKAFDLSTEDNETAINNVQSSISNVQSIFDANGMKLQSLRKGLNIVKKNDGNVQKIMVK